MTDPVLISAFYQFTPVADPAQLVNDLRPRLAALGTFGTLIVASEGINGTLASPAEQHTALLNELRGIPGFASLPFKTSGFDRIPFEKLRLSVRPEIVTMRAGEPSDPNVRVGEYIPPQAWNELIRSEDVVLVDTRNDFEFEAGTFEGALNPKIVKFADFPDWFEAQNFDKTKRIAMFCTGGIRCERATSWALAKGYENIYHLEGGILAYLEQVSSEDTTWRGSCFVFDDRIGVGHENLRATKPPV